MTDSHVSPDLNPDSPIAYAAGATGGPRTSRLLCWLVILASIGATLGMHLFTKSIGRSETQAYGVEEEALAIPLVEMQARLLYTFATEPGGTAVPLAVQMRDTINVYAVTPRLAAHIAAANAGMIIDDSDPLATIAIDAAELDESQLAEINELAAQATGLLTTPTSEADVDWGNPRFAAAKRALLLLALNEPEPDDEEGVRLHELVRGALLTAAPLDRDTAEELRDELGWFGKALVARNADRDSADAEAARRPGQTTVAAMLTLAVVAIGGAVVGLALLVIGLSFYFGGSLKPRFTKPLATPGIYLEAFAVYLGLFTFVVQGGSLLLESRGVSVGMAANVGLVLVSFLGMAWPFLRTLEPRSVVAQDLGMHRGEGLIREAFMGLVGYLAGLPIVGLGLLLTLGIMAVQTYLAARGGGEEAGPPAVMAHPIIIWLADGGLGLKILLLVFGAVFAPIVEETLFRGCLLGYLRNSLPFIPAALLVAFIFAVIHPQGVMAVPVLMSLAVSFAMIREWRGSLVGPMVAHALNNGTVLTMMWIAFS